MRYLTIIGSVHVDGCPACARQLRVEAWDADDLCDDFVGSALTDAGGGFRIAFSEDHYRGLFRERHPDLYFRVYRGPQLLKRTDNEILWNLRQEQLKIVIKLSKVDLGNCCSDSEPENLSSLGKLQSFIPLDRFALINQAILKAVDSREQRRALAAIVGRWRRSSRRLDLLLTDSRLLLRGSSLAGGRMLRLLHQLSISYQAGQRRQQPSRPQMVQPISWITGYVPQLPGFGRFDPCLFPPGGWLDLYFGLEFLETINPNQLDLLNRYRDVLQWEVEALQPLESIYQAAIAVQLDPTGAQDYFEQTVLAFGDLVPAVPQSLIPRQPNPSMGTPQPISLDLNDGLPGRLRPWLDLPFPAFDFCRLQRWLDTARVDACWQALQDRRYSIDSLNNLTKGSGVGRQACVGDRIEIRGENFGEEGQILFAAPLGVVVVDVTTTSWGEDRIEFVVPDGAQGGELLLDIPLGVDGCGDLRRLPRGLPDLRLQVFSTLQASDVVFQLERDGMPLPKFEVEGTIEINDVSVEACSSPVLLRIDVPGASTVQVLRGTELFWESAEMMMPIRAELPVPTDARASRLQIFRLTASNLCSVYEEEIRLSLLYKINYSLDPARFEPDPGPVELANEGDILPLHLRLSCPAPAGGKSLTVGVSEGADYLSVDGESVTFAEGLDTASIVLRAIGRGPATLVVSDETGLYSTLRIAVRVAPVVLEVLPGMTSIRTWINETIRLPGRGFTVGETFVIFPLSGRRREGISVPATIEGTTTPQAVVVVPEQAETGVLYVEVVAANGRVIRSDNSLPIEIQDPVIDSLDPAEALRGQDIAVVGRGFSRDTDANTIVFEASASEPSPPTTQLRPEGETPPFAFGFAVPNALSFFTRSLHIDVAPLDGRRRSSAPMSFRCMRLPGAFRQVVFGIEPQSCPGDGGGNPFLRIGSSTWVDFGGVPLQVFPSEFGPDETDPSSRIFAGPPLRFAGAQGGANLSPCCQHVAYLSYLDGGFESLTPSRWSLTILEVANDFQIHEGPYWSTSGEGQANPGGRLPELWFSPDCCVMAVVSFTMSDQGVVFYDVPTPGSGRTARLLHADLAGVPPVFRAAILPGNRLEYDIVMGSTIETVTVDL